MSNGEFTCQRIFGGEVKFAEKNELCIITSADIIGGVIQNSDFSLFLSFYGAMGVFQQLPIIVMFSFLCKGPKLSYIISLNFKQLPASERGVG